MAPQVAWLGLGNMGSGMCKNLVEKGNLDKPLILWNRTTSRTELLSSKLGADKTKVVHSISDAATEADIIFMCLGDDASVNDAVDIILEQDVKGKLVVDCTTVHPETSNATEKRLTENGVDFVSMPVFGSPAMAEVANLVCMMAGTSKAISRVKPYTKGVIGKVDIDYSDQPAGNVLILKLIGNTFLLNMIEILSEGHTLAEKSGLGSANLHTFIESMFPGPYIAYSKRMMGGDYYQRDRPQFQVDLARKDARHALDLAQKNGCSVPSLAIADDHLLKVKQHLGEKGDMPSIYGVVRQESGLKFEIS